MLKTVLFYILSYQKGRPGILKNTLYRRSENIGVFKT